MVKERHNFTIDPAIMAIAKKLAKKDRRSVSSLLEVLIEQENKRRKK